MSSVEFQVSAKTARLIGRENISEVDGAILELVKNGYDADAECVYIKYYIPYTKIPNILTATEVRQNFNELKEEINKFYYVDKGQYVLRDGMSDEQINQLRLLLLSLSSIVVLDNGCGMTRKILETTWMNIGTDDKEINIRSKKKDRIKTGAKGIGRFALDKLSLQSKIISKNEEDNTVSWEIDWTQFDNAKLLNQVKANINDVNSDFVDVVKALVEEDFNKISNYEWKTGTAIILSPIREFWNTQLFKKVNNNLQNINPLGSVDRFDVIVRNKTNKELNFETKSGNITRESYDYLIEAEYDGKNLVTLIMDRNEIDIRKKTVSVKYSEDDIETYELNEFWKRKAFESDKHSRESYNQKVKYVYELKEIFTKESEETLKEFENVGPIKLNVYYSKSTKSTVEIIKDIKVRKRKKLLKDFSGIKIYRDEFKVRPYGDEGVFYDWVNLSERVQKSPAAASHLSGNWRVSPYQVIGSVSISRITNANLEDTANREGMNINSAYYAFVKLIQGIFEKFEYDRQYPLREYAVWLNDKRKKHNDKVKEVYESVMREKKDENQKKCKDNDSSTKDTDKQNYNANYTTDDLKDVIYQLGNKQENENIIEQLLMVLSAAGVMTQTFTHEISRIATNLGSRGQHLRAAIDRLLNFRPYVGDEDFNPYDMIEDLDSTDLLLSEWVNLIMESVRKENFYSQEINIERFLMQVKDNWTPLLDKKQMKIANIECEPEIILKLPVVDLHLLLNNFLLNSAYFLEECEGERIIYLRLYKKDEHIILDMKNNGPILDEKYKQNPDQIFDATISSKENGTGLGLWIAREAVQRNYGNLHVIPISDGFMIQASWKI